MELTQLQYYRAVARYENITRAAEALHISQPALSKSMSKLENELGVSLFIRDGNRIRLSQSGQLFLGCVDRAVTQLNFGVEELQGLQGDAYGQVKFASFSTGLVSEPLRGLIRQYPNVSVSHYTLPSEEIKTSLERGEIDLALSLFPIESTAINWFPVAEDELIVLVSDGNELSKTPTISLRQLENQDIALPDPELGLRRLFESYCTRAGFVPRIRYEGNDSDMVMSLVRDDELVFVLPASIHIWKVASDKQGAHKSLQEVFRKPFAFSALRIADPVCSYTIGMNVPREKTASRAAAVLHKMLMEYFEKYNAIRRSDEYDTLLRT